MILQLQQCPGFAESELEWCSSNLLSSPASFRFCRTSKKSGLKALKESTLENGKGWKSRERENDYLILPPLVAGRHTVTPDSLLAVTFALVSTFQKEKLCRKLWKDILHRREIVLPSVPWTQPAPPEDPSRCGFSFHGNTAGDQINSVKCQNIETISHLNCFEWWSNLWPVCVLVVNDK